jgi:hypothetical protein
MRGLHKARKPRSDRTPNLANANGGGNQERGASTPASCGDNVLAKTSKQFLMGGSGSHEIAGKLRAATLEPVVLAHKPSK